MASISGPGPFNSAGISENNDVNDPLLHIRNLLHDKGIPELPDIPIPNECLCERDDDELEQILFPHAVLREHLGDHNIGAFWFGNQQPGFAFKVSIQDEEGTLVIYQSYSDNPVWGWHVNIDSINAENDQFAAVKQLLTNSLGNDHCRLANNKSSDLEGVRLLEDVLSVYSPIRIAGLPYYEADPMDTSD